MCEREIKYYATRTIPSLLVYSLTYPFKDFIEYILCASYVLYTGDIAVMENDRAPAFMDVIN